MTICSERWLGLGLSLDVRSESNHAPFGIPPTRFFNDLWFSKSWFVSREFFYFQIPGGVLSLFETVLGEIIGLSRRTGLSAAFSNCRAGPFKRAKPAAWDPLPDC